MTTSGAYSTLAGLGSAPTFEAVVVGGGITGVQVARELAVAGRRVLLLEAGDFGSGTSSATTKYIHGGIRYLESREFGVVRESLRERRLLTLSAPHLVAQQSFIMPAWTWSKPGAGLIGLGMGLYWALAYDRNADMPDGLRVPRSRWLRVPDVVRRAPWIRQVDLLGAWEYHDTLNQFPERLLLEFLNSALAAGATAVNYARVTEVLTSGGPDGIVIGVTARDPLTGHASRIQAPLVVNATGPWVDTLLPRSERPVKVQRSKGVHILTHQIQGHRQQSTVFARARSGRHVISSPWQGRLLIGPTDTPLNGDMESLSVEKSDINLILDVFNETLNPGIPALGPDDVIDTIVGVRPLIGGDSESTYTASRRHDIAHHANEGYRGLYTLFGGKWTTGRATAEDLLRRLSRDGFVSPNVRSATRSLPVTSSFGWAVDPQPFIEDIVRESEAAGLRPAYARHLAGLYGTTATKLLHLCFQEPALREPLSEDPEILDLAVQVRWAVECEGARTLADIVDRRLALGTMGAAGSHELHKAASIAGPLLGVDPQELAETEMRRRMILRAVWSPA